MGNADLRRKKQLEFLESGNDIVVGNVSDLPLSIDEIMSIDKNSKYVAKFFDSGLTADVFKLSIDGRNWTLKKKKEKILVNNIDGQTSFLNEVQRRRDFEILKQENREAYVGIVDTTYASLNKGFILSPWIEGSHITEINEKILESLFSTLYYVEISGLFEYDLCSGNLLLDEEGTVKLFDFGYMYPYEPLKEFNPDGIEQPIFHFAERFESRFFMEYLMELENTRGKEIVMQVYKLEKQVALKYYQMKLNWLIHNNPERKIIEWTKSIIDRWQQGVSKPTNLNNLYSQEAFRSYVLDISDDISGQSCTVDTIKKVKKVIEIINSKYEFLKEHKSFFWNDENLNKEQLIEKYTNNLRLAELYQIER